MVTVTCSWCHTPVDVTGGPATCPACGHRAGVPRLDCDCPTCSRVGARLADEPDDPDQ